jgi:hypothetical protein
VSNRIDSVDEHWLRFAVRPPPGGTAWEGVGGGGDSGGPALVGAGGRLRIAGVASWQDHAGLLGTHGCVEHYARVCSQGAWIRAICGRWSVPAVSTSNAEQDNLACTALVAAGELFDPADVLFERRKPNSPAACIHLVGILQQGRSERPILLPADRCSVHLDVALHQRHPVHQEGDLPWLGLPGCRGIPHEREAATQHLGVGHGVEGQQPGRLRAVLADQAPAGPTVAVEDLHSRCRSRPNSSSR